MTSPAAAARRQYALDRIVEDLVEWGCPLEHADERAARVLDRALDAGYRLPDSVADAAPPPGEHSTVAGRVRAKVLFAHHRAADEWLPPRYPVDEPPTVRARCACRAWTGPERLEATALTGDHDAHLAAMLVVAGVATVAERLNARPDRGVAAPNTRPPVPEGPKPPRGPQTSTERDA